MSARPSRTLGCGMYRLVFLSGRNQGKRLVVRQTLTVIGRAPECHLRLPDDDQLALQHACFEERGTGVYVSGLTPGFPLEHNGQPVAEPVRLAHNDVLVLGQTQIRFENIIAPQPRRHRTSFGLLQPATGLVIVALLLLELGLLAYLLDWPGHLITPQTEAVDVLRHKRNRIRKVRAAQLARSKDQTKSTGQTTAPATVVTLPGTAPAVPVAPLTNNTGGSPAPLGEQGLLATPAHQLLSETDFPPVDTNTTMIDLPPVSTADPLIEEAQRMLAEAVSAAEFADYAKAARLLSQIHQNAPDFLPAHIEHARLLEVRGNLDDAYQRWTRILDLAPEDSPYRAQALRERERLAGIQALQTRIVQLPGTLDLNNMPRHVRIASPSLQKIPPDADVVEMRILKTTLDLAPGAPLFKDANIQVFITFYDATPDGRIQPTRAITTPSPMAFGQAFADRRSLPLEATYVVTRGLRSQETEETGGSWSYYGYTLHVFAGQILEDAVAKPNKLLERPVFFPEANAEP